MNYHHDVSITESKDYVFFYYVMYIYNTDEASKIIYHLVLTDAGETFELCTTGQLTERFVNFISVWTMKFVIGNST